MAGPETPMALVVDDNGLIRIDASHILEDAGFSVRTAADVPAALVILAEEEARMTLLFTDVDMPPSELTGFHLARECAARWPHIGILVASGTSQPKPGDLPPGATFIYKPFSAEIVRRHLRRVLDKEQRPEQLD